MTSHVKSSHPGLHDTLSLVLPMCPFPSPSSNLQILIVTSLFPLQEARYFPASSPLPMPCWPSGTTSPGLSTCKTFSSFNTCYKCHRVSVQCPPTLKLTPTVEDTAFPSLMGFISDHLISSDLPQILPPVSERTSLFLHVAP